MNNLKKSDISYLWQGINGAGIKQKGIINAQNKALAIADLRKQGIITKKLHKKRPNLFMQFHQRITSKEITLFIRQLATLFSAGIPLVQSIDIIANGQRNNRQQSLISTIKVDLESGLTLAEALKKHFTFFSPLICHLIEVGEKSGSLDKMLNNVADYKEKIEIIKKKIKKTLAYPLIIVLIACVVTTALLIYVVPQFQILFESFGAELPLLTQAVINLSKFLHHKGYLILLAIGSISFGLYYAKKHLPHIAQFLDHIILHCPIIGIIHRNSAIARFSRTLVITYAAGLPLVEALQSVANATGNNIYTRATLNIQQEIINGQPLHFALNNTQLFPHRVIQMVAIGEESGSLEYMLNKIADFYDDEINQAIETLNRLLEPLIITFLGLVIGGLIIAMYLPIFQLGQII